MPVRILMVVLLLSIGCSSSVREVDGQAAAPPMHSESVAMAPAAPASCHALERLPARPAPPLEILDRGDGTKMLISAEAGYTILAPESWLVTTGSWATPAFGQAHLTSYDPKTVDYRMETTHGMVAPEAGIRLDIEVWTRPEDEPLDRYATRVPIGPSQTAVLPGHFVTLAGRRAYRATIQDEHRYQPTSGPPIVTRQTRLLWLVPTLRPDRVLVIYATPAESSLRALAEATVATLQLSRPVVSEMPIVHRRDEIVRRWLYDEKTGQPIAGRRAEAKLVTYAESRAAMQGGSGLLRIDRDPEELFWLVAVTGPGLPLPRGGLGGPGSTGATPSPTAWMLYQTPATNDRSEGTGGQSSSNGTWPPGFDGLTDRCR